MKLEVKGKYNSAIVMTDQIEEECGKSSRSESTV